MRLDHDAIREWHATGNYTHRQLAAEFDCDKSSIARIVGPKAGSNERGHVWIVYCPEDLFTGGKFGLGDLVAGAMPFDEQQKRGPKLAERTFLLADGEDSIYQEVSGISWLDGTQFEIGKNGSQMRAECRNGKIWREDGRVLIPNCSGNAVWK